MLRSDGETPRRSAPARPSRPEAPDRWGLVLVAGGLSFLAMLDMSIVNLALVDLAGDLRISDGVAQWAVLGYQLPLVALLLPAGRWLDRVGTRPALRLAVAGFALAAVVAAAAPSAVVLILARVVQGGFGAVLFVLMPVLAMRSVRPGLRGRAMSVPATLGPLGAVLGPALGGVLLDQLGWRAIFLVKLPVCLAAWLVARHQLPREGRLERPGRSELADAAAVGGAVAAVLLALTLATDRPAGLLVVALAVPPALYWLRRGGRPVRTVLRENRTGGLNCAVLAVAAGFAAVHYLVALHLQREGAAGATATGLTLLCFPLAMGLAGPVGGRLADRFGARPTATAGAALTALGFLLLVPVQDGWTLPDLAWRLALAGAGTGLYGGPSQAMAMGSAAPAAMATAASTVQLARSLGFALGPAVATAVWSLAGPGAGPHPDTGLRVALAVAAGGACLAVPLLARHGSGAGGLTRSPDPDPGLGPGRAVRGQAR
ncbi:MFS transporter [Kitasatospora sp. NPDC096147]|uniref:MFS transporter n=1 Tax=Kitasatospora sp. NPDC096147 TaxID=3364093 RepID=UPI0038087B8B